MATWAEDFLRTRQASQEADSQSAFGNTLKYLYSNAIPGGSPMPGVAPGGGGSPTGPGAGAPPMAAASAGGAPNPLQGLLGLLGIGGQRPPMQQQPQMAQPQMPMGGAPGPGAGPPGGMPQQPPMGGGGQPQMPGGMPGMGGQGQLDWRSIISKVVQANPGAPPYVIAGAVDRFLPLMNAQSQQQWREMSLMLREQTLAANQDRWERDRASREDVAAGRRETMERGQDIQAGSRAAAEAGRVERADKAETGRKDRANASLAERQREFDIRQERLKARDEVNKDTQYQRIDLQRQNLQRQIIQGGQRQLLANWRAQLDAQHKRAIEVIQAYSVNNSLKPDQKKALLKEQGDAYNAALSQMREAVGSSTPSGSNDTMPSPSGEVGNRFPDQSGAKPVQTQSVKPTATNEKGEKVEWDGSKWVPVKK